MDIEIFHAMEREREIWNIKNVEYQNGISCDRMNRMWNIPWYNN
jgi:hypothetical protein